MPVLYEVVDSGKLCWANESVKGQLNKVLNSSQSYRCSWSRLPRCCSRVIGLQRRRRRRMKLSKHGFGDWKRRLRHWQEGKLCWKEALLCRSPMCKRRLSIRHQHHSRHQHDQNNQPRHRLQSHRDRRMDVNQGGPRRALGRIAQQKQDPRGMAGPFTRLTGGKITAGQLFSMCTALRCRLKGRADNVQRMSIQPSVDHGNCTCRTS